MSRKQYEVWVHYGVAYDPPDCHCMRRDEDGVLHEQPPCNYGCRAEWTQYPELVEA